MSRLDHGVADIGVTGFASSEGVERLERGLSREYLWHLGQLVTMIARSPAELDVRASVLAWRLQSYQEFFMLSDGCDAASALREYARLDPIIRRSFEAIVRAFDKVAADAIRLLAQPSRDLEREIEQPLRTMRMLLDRAATLVEDGDTLAADAAGRRANRSYAR